MGKGLREWGMGNDAGLKLLRGDGGGPRKTRLLFLSGVLFFNKTYYYCLLILNILCTLNSFALEN
jgi:hypothetical protein